MPANAPPKLHAIAATVLTNLIAFAAWVSLWGSWWPLKAAIKRSLRAKLRRGGQAFHRILVLLAVQRIAPPKRRAPTPHPANAPPGFRVQVSGKARRFLHISGLHQGSIHERIARLQLMLEHIELWVARFVKRLQNRTKVSRLVLAYAIAAACRELACAPPAHADTS